MKNLTLKKEQDKIFEFKNRFKRLFLSPEEEFDKVIIKISNIAIINGIRVFAVGGYVRDKLFEIPLSEDADLDITAERAGDALMLAYLIVLEEGLPNPEIYPVAGVAVLTVDGKTIEFKGERREQFHVINWLEESGIELSNLIVDVYSRDFTINSILLDLASKELLDLSHMGQADIENRYLRTLIDPVIFIQYNPVAMLRALRFRKQFDLTIAGDLDSAIRENAHLIANENLGKIKRALDKIFEYGAQDLLDEYGISEFIPQEAFLLKSD